MFRTKKDVDRHVQEILRKLKTENERNLRCYNIAKLYYQVGDYESAKRYVSSYLEVREESAGAHKLFGQILEALDQKEAALREYKCSLELEGRQGDLVLKVCELLADTDVGMDVSRARYWLERADRIFPHHPIVFQLKEKLLMIDRPSENLEDLKALIASELLARPMDVTLRVKLLRHYMDKNKFDDAYKHALGVEATHAFRDNIIWYHTLCETLVKCKESKRSEWSFWVLYVSVLERYATLCLKEQGDGPKKTVPEAAQAVLNFDQSLTEAEPFKKNSNDTTFAEHMFAHMSGQLHLHLACLLLRKTKREQGSWTEAGRLCSPLLLCALHTTPPDPTAPWVTRLKDQQKAQVTLWYREGSYRCSQAGHVLQDYARGDTKRFLEKIAKFSTGAWRERVYQRIFQSRVQQQIMKSSFFANESASNPPLRLCTHSELKHHDEVSEAVWPASLHHQVWLGIKSKPHQDQHSSYVSPYPHQYSHIFPELQFSVYNLSQAGAASLNRLDIDAFLNAAVLCASVVVEEQLRSGFLNPDRLPTLPADITNTLCSGAQEKWWTSAYKMYCEQEGVGSEIGEIRQVLQRGLEVIRCIDNHGLHPCILVHLARIFHYRAKLLKEKHEEHSDLPALESRCELYWSAAVPLLERLQNNQVIRSTGAKLFDYQGKEMNNVELTNALDEGRLLLAQRYLRDKQYDQAIETLQALKCPEASFQQGQVYKTLADELVSSLPRENLTSEMRSQHIIMLSKARDCFYLTLDRLRSPGTNPKHPLNAELCIHISGIENELKRIDPDLWRNDLNRNDCDELSDETYSSAHSGDHPIINTSFPGAGITVNKLNTPQKTTHRTPNQSSTPCRPWFPQHQENLEFSRLRSEARPSPERLDAQIRQLIHSRDNVIQTIMDQNKALLESNKAVIEQLGELKKEVEDLRKETQKQRNHAPVNPTLEEDLYVLGEEDYGDLNYGAAAANQPTGATPFPTNIFSSAQRHPAYPTLVYPSGTLQGYYQPGLTFGDQASHISTLYPPSVYPIPALYSQPPPIPVDPKLGPLSKVPENVLPGLLTGRLQNQVPEESLATDQPLLQRQNMESTKNDSSTKDSYYRAPPVNVVITTSDTLPTTTSSVQPTLSVTIPAHHRLGGNTPATNVPHNYQISMPSQATIPTTVNLPPFSTTLTTAMLSTMSASEKYGGNTSVISSSTANDSNEWSAEPEHDPIPDFVPVIPLPAEVEIMTGEEGETTLYAAKAKLFRFVDKEWKERGVGEVKLLRNNEGKVRLLMRRDQVLKICANHLLRSDMELNKMSNNDKAFVWIANDFADEEVKLEKLCIKFKTEDEAANFKLNFDKAKENLPKSSENTEKPTRDVTPTKQDVPAPVVVGGFSFAGKPIIQTQSSADTAKASPKLNEAPKQSPFATFSFNKSDTSTKASYIGTQSPNSDSTNPISTGISIFTQKPTQSKLTGFSFGHSTSTVATPASFSFGTSSVPVVATQADSTSMPAKNGSTTIQPKKSDEGQSSSNVFPVQAPLRRPHAPAPAELAMIARIEETSKKSEDNSADQNLTKDTEETVEEFVPTAEFSPVIPLPNIVKVITGEEGETILFEARARLLRFDSDSKQWKERGVGQMKILLEPTSGKVRLLMRREQVLKVCCNHSLLAEINFQFRADNNKAITWCAQDYSDSEVKPETFTIRFKTPDQASEFYDIITSHQKKMVNDRIPSSTEETSTIKSKPADNKKNQKSSLAEMFKPASDTWECQACYIRNSGSDNKCIACQAAAPTTVRPTDIPTSTIKSKPADNKKNQKSSLAEMFKPAGDSWECQACYIRNSGSNNKCIACHAAAPATVKPTDIPSSTNSDKIATTSTEALLSELSKPAAVPNKSWDNNCVTCDSSNDSSVANMSKSIQSNIRSEKPPLSALFRPATGSWECKGCYVCNSSAQSYCIACDAPKEPSMPPKPKSSGFNITSSSASAPSFTFGIPRSDSKDPGNGGFTFGASKSIAKAGGDSAAVLTFGSQPVNDTSTFTFGSPPSLPIPRNEEKPFTFGTPGKLFDFQFQEKSPVKSPGGAETSEDEVPESEDVYFAPIIPLPDKVDVKTGEENEEVLYSHRAKLFRYESNNKEWKERGIGDIKLLKHSETGKLRLLMRRDQVLKLCLNHIIPLDMEFTAKDDKTWLWYAADYSEGDISHEQFACRFKTSEIAQDFKTAIENAKLSAKASSADSTTKIDNKATKSPSTIKKNLFRSSSDVEIVYECTVSPEEKAAALNLKLPENFYAYKRLPDCPGCIGCSEVEIPLFTSTNTASTTTSTTKSAIQSSHQFESKTSIFTPPKLSIVTSPSNMPNLEDTKTTSSLHPTTTVSSKSLFTSSPSTKSSTFDGKLGTDVFKTVTSTTGTASTPPMLSGLPPKLTSHPAKSTVTTIFGGSGSITTTSNLQPVFCTSLTTTTPNKSALLFGVANKSSSTVPNTNETGTIYSFGDPPNKGITDDVGDKKLLENSKICSPANFTAPTIPTTTNVFAGSGTTFFGSTSVPSSSIFGGTKSATPIFAANTVFGCNSTSASAPFTNIFGGSGQSAPITTSTSSIIDTEKLQTSTPVFGTLATSQSTPNVFGSVGNSNLPDFGSLVTNRAQNNFANNAKNDLPNLGGTKSIFGTNSTSTSVFQSPAKDIPISGLDLKTVPSLADKSDNFAFLSSDNATTFSTLAAVAPEKPAFQTDPNFSFVGAGSSVFGSKPTSNTSGKSKKQNESMTKKDEEDNEDKDEEADNGEEHDPHFEPIIPLPDAIEVRTGEEEEEKVFCQRAKLYRYVNATKEWKERGVGEMKLLHHSNHGTYRLLMRREQVHKVVCNLLLTSDLEFRSLNSSDRAWCWAGMNYAEEDPVLEELAIKFKNPELAVQFKDAIDRAQQALREKHSIDQENKRRDNLEAQDEDEKEEKDDQDEPDDEEADEDDDNEEYSIMFEKKATLMTREDGNSRWQVVSIGDLKILYDHHIFGARIVLETDDTGEVASNTVISMQTRMQINGKECMWSAMDYALEQPVTQNLKAIFSSITEAEEMFMSFEEGQGFARESEIMEPELYIPEEGEE